MSGTKFDNDKIRMDLLPTRPIEEVAKVLTNGAKKYADRDWERGLAWSRCYGALLRHTFAWWNGESYSQDDNNHHLASVICNAMFLLEFEKTHPELDDRPKPPTQEARLGRAPIADAIRAEAGFAIDSPSGYDYCPSTEQPLPKNLEVGMGGRGTQK